MTRPSVGLSLLADGAQIRPAMVAMLIPILMFSAQAPSYLNDFTPTYVIAKAWPVLTLPFTLRCLVLRNPPGKALLLSLLVYTIGFTPVRAMVVFDATFVAAIQTASKMGGFLNYFALFEILFLLRPSVAELQRAMVSLGVFTFAMMWFLWVTVPLEVYTRPDNDSLLFLFDLERGPRIYAPMVFGIFLIFTIVRDFWRKPRLLPVVLLVGAFTTLFVIYKQKLAILSVVMVILLSAFRAFPRRRMMIVALVMIGLCGGLFVLAAKDWSGVTQSVGGSLETRLISGGYVVDFLQTSPSRWLLGVGSLPQHGGRNLGDLFRFKMFFVSDLGWLGIIFEYGLAGAGLVFAVYAMATRQIWLGTFRGDPWSLVLLDYPLYLWCVLTVYSAVVAPGEIMTYLNLATYTGMQYRAQKALA